MSVHWPQGHTCMFFTEMLILPTKQKEAGLLYCISGLFFKSFSSKLFFLSPLLSVGYITSKPKYMVSISSHSCHLEETAFRTHPRLLKHKSLLSWSVFLLLGFHISFYFLLYTCIWYMCSYSCVLLCML